MVDIKNKILRSVSCFCKLLHERYTEKLMKEYASVYGLPEHGNPPKFDEQKLQKFEDCLPNFESDLSYLVAQKLKLDGKARFNTLHSEELEQLCYSAFGKDMQSIVGSYQILLEIDDKMAKVDLVVPKGYFCETFNALTLFDSQNEYVN